MVNWVLVPRRMDRPDGALCCFASIYLALADRVLDIPQPLGTRFNQFFDGVLALRYNPRDGIGKAKTGP